MVATFSSIAVVDAAAVTMSVAAAATAAAAAATPAVETAHGQSPIPMALSNFLLAQLTEAFSGRPVAVQQLQDHFQQQIQHSAAAAAPKADQQPAVGSTVLVTEFLKQQVIKLNTLEAAAAPRRRTAGGAEGRVREPRSPARRAAAPDGIKPRGLIGCGSHL